MTSQQHQRDPEAFPFTCPQVESSPTPRPFSIPLLGWVSQFHLVPFTPSLVGSPMPLRKDCHPLLWIRGVPLKEVWWFAQSHPADIWGRRGCGLLAPAPGLFPDPGLRSATPAVPRQRLHRPGGPVLLKASLSSRPPPGSQRKTRTSRISSAGAWREASWWLRTVPPPDPGSVPRGPSELGFRLP